MQTNLSGMTTTVRFERHEPIGGGLFGDCFFLPQGLQFRSADGCRFEQMTGVVHLVCLNEKGHWLRATAVRTVLRCLDAPIWIAVTTIAMRGMG